MHYPGMAIPRRGSNQWLICLGNRNTHVHHRRTRPKIEIPDFCVLRGCDLDVRPVPHCVTYHNGRETRLCELRRLGMWTIFIVPLCFCLFVC